MVHGEGIEPRADDVVAEDPAAPVKGVQRQAASAKKRAFTLEELRTVLKVADPEWKSMIPFGLYTGQRLADVATLRWDNLDLAKDEIRFTTRKTGRPTILPIAKSPREYLARPRLRPARSKDLKVALGAAPIG